jgi:Carboxylesterase family
VDLYAYNPRHIEDPIISGIIAQSGTAITAMNLGAKLETAKSDWYTVSKLLSCGGSEAGDSKTIQCMRQQPAEKIMEVVNNITGNSMLGPFQAVIDEKTVFSDLRKRAESGQFVKVVSINIRSVMIQGQKANNLS